MAKKRVLPRMPRTLFVLSVSLMLTLLLSQCEQLPTNPVPGKSDLQTVTINHVGTDYVAAQTTMEGLATSKVNMLTFEIQTHNFEARALDIFGRVILDGPPYEREQSLHFRTDILLQKENEVCICLDELISHKSYRIIRSQFPTNEYSPFIGDQGKVREVIISHVTAIDADGQEISIPFTN
jgi:hypothetical protein